MTHRAEPIGTVRPRAKQAAVQKGPGGRGNRDPSCSPLGGCGSPCGPQSDVANRPWPAQFWVESTVVGLPVAWSVDQAMECSTPSLLVA